MRVVIAILQILALLVAICATSGSLARRDFPQLEKPYRTEEVCDDGQTHWGTYCRAARGDRAYYLSCRYEEYALHPDHARFRRVAVKGACPWGYHCKPHRPRVRSGIWDPEIEPMPIIDCIPRPKNLKWLELRKRPRSEDDDEDGEGEGEDEPSKRIKLIDFMGRAGSSSSQGTFTDTDDRSSWGYDLTLASGAASALSSLAQ